MPSVTYEIDPFADTVIILQSPCRDFAPWDDTLTLSSTVFTEQEEQQPIPAQPSEDKRAGKKLTKKQKKLLERARASRERPASSIPEDNGERAEPSAGGSSGEQELVYDPEPAQTVEGGVEEPGIESAEPACEPIDPEDHEIRYLVSSRHLMLASPWFRRLLARDDFIEASRDPSDGRYHVPASDWDEEAFLILLNIFHIRTRGVPATVDLEMLAKIAVLVDYYELENAEVMERDIKGWITNVRRSVPIPSSYCRDLMLWICISRVFHMDEEFEKATALAIRATEGWMQTLDLPIHEEITSSIDRIRCKTIENIISELHRLLDVYKDFNYSCSYNSSYSFQCGAFLFGSLMKYMEKWGCITPRPENPFIGTSLNGLDRRSGTVEKSTWWHKGRHYNNYGLYEGKFEAHPCSLHDKINEVVQNALAKVKGLKLQDFPENRQMPLQS